MNQPTLKLDIVHEDISKTLNNFIPPNTTIIKANNGYLRSSLDGLTVVFFKQLQTKSYHIVICEINEDELRKNDIAYEDLTKLNFDLIF